VERVEAEVAEVAEGQGPILASVHPAHPSAGKPLPQPEILAIIKSVFKEWDASQMNLQELWTESALSVACGGQTEYILKAIREVGTPDDKWTIVDEGRKWEVSVLWGAYVRKRSWVKDDDDAAAAANAHNAEEDDDDDFELEEEFERSVVISEGWGEEEEEDRDRDSGIGGRLGRSGEVEVESLPDNEVGSWSVLSSHSESGWGANTRDSVWASQTWSDAAQSPRTTSL